MTALLENALHFYRLSFTRESLLLTLLSLRARGAGEAISSNVPELSLCGFIRMGLLRRYAPRDDLSINKYGLTLMGLLRHFVPRNDGGHNQVRINS